MQITFRIVAEKVGLRFWWKTGLWCITLGKGEISAAKEMRSQGTCAGVGDHKSNPWASWSVYSFTAHLFKHEDPESWLGYSTLIHPLTKCPAGFEGPHVLPQFFEVCPESSKQRLRNLSIICGNRKRKQSKVSCTFT